MHVKTRAISEGAMMLAFTLILLLLNRQLVGSFDLMMFLLSIPLVLYSVKYGMKMGCTLSLAAILSGFMFSTFTSMFYLISAIVIGLLYAYGVNHKWNNGSLLFICILGNIVVTVITMIVMASVFGFSIQEDIALLSAMIPANSIGMDVTQFLIVIVLLSYLFMAFIQSIVTHMLAIILMKRLHILDIPMKSIYDITFPRWSVIFVVGAYVLYFMMPSLSLSDIAQQLVLVYYCLMMVYATFAGAMTILCYMSMTHKLKKASTYLVCIACFIPIVQMVIAFIGIFDIYGEIRKKMKEGVLHEIH